MIGNGNHIIGKQIIDCEYNGFSDGVALQQQLTEWCYQQLIPGIEAELQTLDTGNYIFPIDKLEIAVQIDATGNWMGRITEQVVQQVYKLAVSEINRLQTNSSLPLKKQTELFEEVFVYFLQYGNLPWWSTVTSYQTWEQELQRLLTTGFSENAKVSIRQLMKATSVQQRIIYQTSDELFIALMTIVNDQVRKDITNLINDIKQLVPVADERKIVLSVFKKSVIVCMYDVNAGVFAEQVYAHFVQQLSATGRLHHWPAGKNNTAIPPHKKIVLPEQHASTDKELDPVKENVAGNKTPAAVPSPEEGLYTNNTGLVIIAPFLSTLFKKLALYDGTALTDINKAVCLTQYLSTGREQVAEFELGLAKILCGLELDTPVDTGIRFTATEKHEANDLLCSAIEYWEILKDTTPEGLQQSFLQRQGKLVLLNNTWFLKVEQKPWDVLLQHLPWNISMLKLPWMERMLRTEWT